MRIRLERHNSRMREWNYRAEDGREGLVFVHSQTGKFVAVLDDGTSLGEDFCGLPPAFNAIKSALGCTEGGPGL